MILKGSLGQTGFYFTCVMHLTENYAHFYSRSVDVQTPLLNCRMPVKNSGLVGGTAVGNGDGGCASE